MTKNKKMIFLQLNELNFDYINEYINNGLDLPGFQKIREWNSATLKSEDSYELLEPWIQWSSIHSGLEFKGHKIFRLGDAVTKTHKTIFELIEENGYSVGAVSPMNVVNRLKSPKFFIPDPWTNTKADNSWVSQFLHAAIRHLVNNNASGKITFPNILRILSVSFYLLDIRDFYKILSCLIKAKLGKKWFKVLAFDFFLSKVFLKLKKKYDPDFSVLFLNGAAHIQHHYLLSSPLANKKMLNKNPLWYVRHNEDPLKDMLLEYDKIIQKIIIDNKIIICTGLTQTKIDKTIFYYRLKDHEDFLNKLRINFLKIEPLMSRDFLIKFSKDSDRNEAYEILNKIFVQGNIKLFGLIEKRKNELFITLDYSMEIFNDTVITDKNMEEIPLNLKNMVVLVAIKNGIHSDKCFLFADKNFLDPKGMDGKHCKNIFQYILKEYPKNRSI